MCVCTFLGEHICEIVSTSEHKSGAPSLHVCLRRVALDLDCFALVVGAEEPAREVGPFPFAPKALLFGALMVAMVPAQLMCKVSGSIVIGPAMATA